VTHVSIDISNPADIRRQLPAVRDLRTEKIGNLRGLVEEVDALGKLIESLEAMVGTENGAQASAANTSPPSRGKTSARQIAIEALRRAGRPMGPSELYRFMQEQDMPVPANANALGATLWTAAKAGAIDRVDRRYSAHPITDYSTLPIDTPFPVPAGDGQHELPPSEGDRE
jgi:hypothetical protein